jgi:hypothetical protein
MSNRIASDLLCYLLILYGVLLRADVSGSQSIHFFDSDPLTHKPENLTFMLERNKIILNASCGGSGPLKVILDTGMAFEGLFLYKKELIAQLGILDTTRYSVGGAGNQSPSTAVTRDSMSFSVGDIVFFNQRIIILNNDRFKGFPSDGVVGYSIFGNHDVHIDYDRHLISLYQPGEFEPDASWTAIPISFKDNKIPWIEASVNTRGDKDVQLSMYIDLASGEGVELLMRDKMKFSLPDNLEESYLGRGVSGDIYGYIGYSEKLVIGPYQLHRVKTAFAPAEIRSKQKGADGVLGNNALRRFNIIFSYSTGLLYLRPNASYSQPFE